MSSSRSTRNVLCATVIAALACNAPPPAVAEDARARDHDRVLALFETTPLIDGHNDVPWQYRTRARNHLDQIDLTDTTDLLPTMHTDAARLRAGGLGAQFWSVYIPTSFQGPGAARAVIEQIDVVHRLVERYPELLEMAYTAQDIVRIHAEGRVASLIGIEGGHSIETSLAVLRQLYRLGARYMTLTHSNNDAWADSATDQPVHNGLSRFGHEVVREMNRLGMMVDLSHVSPMTMHDALDTTEAPVIFSHSSAYTVTQHPRNVPDDVLARLPENGGVVMVTFVPSFINESVREHYERRDLERTRLEQSGLSENSLKKALGMWDREHPAPRAALTDAADHIDHLKKTVGIEHIGIGSDFDGISSTPDGLQDVSTFPDLFAELMARGYSDDELRAIAGNNVLRVMREVERVSWLLRANRSPSDALIEELDGSGSARIGDSSGSRR